MPFADALHLVLENEGGYSDHPADRGGATNFGITQATYDVYRASLGKPRGEVRDISHEDVQDIYQRFYWEKARCDRLPPPLDAYHFDAAVNHGPERAAKFLQAAVGAKQDGVIGPKTLAAVIQAPLGLACERYLAARLRFYADIVAHTASQQVFLKGWLARLDKVRALGEGEGA